MTAATFRREDTECTADDGTVLRGRLYRPDSPGPPVRGSPTTCSRRD